MPRLRMRWYEQVQHLMMVFTDYTFVLTVFIAYLCVEYSVKEIRKCINFVKKTSEKRHHSIESYV